jgi:hypothetical protein
MSISTLQANGGLYLFHRHSLIFGNEGKKLKLHGCEEDLGSLKSEADLENRLRRCLCLANLHN